MEADQMTVSRDVAVLDVVWVTTALPVIWHAYFYEASVETMKSYL